MKEDELAEQAIDRVGRTTYANVKMEFLDH